MQYKGEADQFFIDLKMTGVEVDILQGLNLTETQRVTLIILYNASGGLGCTVSTLTECTPVHHTVLVALLH